MNVGQSQTWVFSLKVCFHFLLSLFLLPSVIRSPFWL